MTSHDSFPQSRETSDAERENMFSRALNVLGIDSENEDAVAAVRAQAFTEDPDTYENFAGLVEATEFSQADVAAELRQDGVAFVRNDEPTQTIDLGEFLG